jgi:hypothetical protein
MDVSRTVVGNCGCHWVQRESFVYLTSGLDTGSKRVNFTVNVEPNRLKVTHTPYPLIRGTPSWQEQDAFPMILRFLIEPGRLFRERWFVLFYLECALDGLGFGCHSLDGDSLESTIKRIYLSVAVISMLFVWLSCSSLYVFDFVSAFLWTQPCHDFERKMIFRCSNGLLQREWCIDHWTNVFHRLSSIFLRLSCSLVDMISHYSWL